MSSLLEFWPTAQSINECIGNEAETLSDAVLLAVHRRMQFSRQSLTDQGLAIQMGEEKLLTEFLTEDLPSGNLLLPIVGSSGIGKSHAIRWLDAQLRRRADHEKRHIILIPKSASLREVLRLILKDLQGPAYDEARRDLDAAPDDMDDLRAREELKAKLIIALERRSQSANARIQEATRRGERPDKAQLRVANHAGPKGLQAFLNDAEISPYIVGGSLAQIARRVTAGLKEGASPKTEFEEKDFNLPFQEGQLEQAGHAARLYYRMISRDTSDNERAFAVKLLNEVLDASIAQMMSLDGTRLSDIFGMVREQLLEEDKELVLLVEDFAAMAGIQGSLLDAMIKEAVHGGKQVRCTMRTALAVTDGYLSHRDTVRTRARYQWVLEDVPTEHEQDTIQVIVDFVGGYLNAARCGRELLARQFHVRAADEDLFAWIPRFEESAGLEDEDRNTLEAFGRSSEGYALFPLNRPMIEQIAKVRLTTPAGKLTFNPRTVINYILRDPMRDYREHFEKGSFPPARYLNFNPSEVDPSVSTLVRRQYPDIETQGRYLSLLHFWGGDPTPGDLDSIQERVYQAFGLKPIRASSPPPPPPPPPLGGGGPHPHPPPPPPPPIRRHPADQFKDVLREWATGKSELGQKHAARIRNAVIAGLKAYISWDREVGPSFDFSGTEPGKRVYIARARGGSPNASQTNALVTVARDAIHEDGNEEERTEVVLNMEALLRLSDEGCPQDYDIVERDIALYANFVEAAAPQVVSYVREGGFSSASLAVPSVAQALIFGARILNLEQAHRKDDASLLATIFRSLPDSTSESEQLGDNPTLWERLISIAKRERKSAIDFLLGKVMARQGDTGRTAYAVDATNLLAAIENFRSDWQVRTGSDWKAVPDDVKNFISQMVKAPRAVSDRISVLKEWRKRVAEALGTNLDGPEKAKLLEKLKEVVLLAERTGTNPTGDEVASSSLRDRLNALGRLPVVDAVRAVDASAEGESQGLDAQLIAVSSVDDHIIRETDRILESYDSFLRRCSSHVKGKLAAVGTDLSVSALVRMDSQLREAAGITKSTLELPEDGGGALAGQEPEVSAIAEDEAEISGFLRRARELEQDLKQIHYRMGKKQLADRINAACEELDAVLEPVRSLKRTSEILSECNLMSEEIFDVPPGFRRALTTVSKNLREDPRKITDGKSFEQIVSALRSINDVLSEQSTKAWKAYVRDTDPKVDAGFLSKITALGHYQAEIDQIKNFNEQMKTALHKLPTTKEEVLGVNVLADGIRAVWQKLPSPSVHKDVQVFLDAIKQSQGAPLNLLTPPVLEWLEHEGLTDSFSIKSSGRPTGVGGGR